MSLLWISLILPLIVLASINDPPRVSTKFGDVVGYYKVSQKGRFYKAFEGIPYAKPPVNELRFEPPQPKNPWISPWNATKKRSVCAQYEDIPLGKDGHESPESKVKGSDDCLYINIYAPVLKENKLMPVIFFIHGGAYQYASGNIFGAKYLADRDLVLVTVNYRLGILGFLSTEDEVVPGNMGLKDQQLALQWTANNIKNFGGDPTKITLAGFSAGSSSVHYHYLSKLSRKFFHNGIAMSGSVFNPWANSVNAKQKAKKLGSIFNCPTNDNRKMIDCLRKVPAQTLANATQYFQIWHYNPEAPFAPIVEKSGNMPFITKSPKEILEAKEAYDAPIVFGAVSEEGCYPAAGYVPYDNVLKELDEQWGTIAPAFLQLDVLLKKSARSKDQSSVANEAKKEYFGNENVSKKTGQNLIRLLNDENYFVGFEVGIRMQARASKNPIYLYYYSFRGSQSYSSHLSRNNKNYGVCHTDDMNLVVENPDTDPTKTTKEWEMSNFLMDMWDSIANNGVPKLNVTWEPVDPSNPELKYLHIREPGNYSMSGDSNFGNKKFWKKYLLTM